MRRGLGVGIGILVLAGIAGVIAPVASQPPNVVRLEPVETLDVAPGAAAETEVRITVADDFHVQANPAANEFLIPLTLDFETTADLEVDDIHYPPGERYRLQGADEDLLVYGGTFGLPVTARAAATAPEGVTTLRGRLRYQACDDKICLAPATLTFDLTARVTAP
ncbi:MAG: protein-disulfide reductase DsbD family protein [Vicinamibacterales bacterium]|jgi:hypothetical protein|nr:hypothetical protein [Acidobacteriota bacterium]MDP6373484.1 protein-disulfide reductase DsbD family protein [Vicinamibacterales bacterium]MDP6607907.1 protein-disulfide reductase DsbD family protein [Vicinamibacterales bacterium]HAK54796.1 hypothetical protein [Acidobacteriota bacterium]|tara:strand:+ start:3059 stop:3553 length:495 start_codon:yes stop_codon:yes gene_type:complete